MDNQEEFQKRIINTFRAEAKEGIAKINQYISLLEEGADEGRSMLVEEIYRESHSLKGASRAVNDTEMELVCQAMETLFSSIKKIGYSFDDAAVFDLLNQTTDVLSELLELPVGEENLELSESVEDIVQSLLEAENVIAKVGKSASNLNEEQVKEITKEVPKTLFTEEIHSNDDTIRMSIETLNKLFTTSEEILSLKINTWHLSGSVDSLSKEFPLWRKNIKGIYSIFEKTLQRSANGNLQLDETEISEFSSSLAEMISFLKETENKLAELKNSTRKCADETFNKINNFSGQIKEIVMVPVYSTLTMFPKICRDIAFNVRKNVAFLIKGENIQIDRRVMEIMNTPLMHIVRNCISHGIESPATRELAGKPAKGQIICEIRQIDNNKVEIKISDDGAGIDLAKLKGKYIKEKKLTQKEADTLDEKTLLDFIFLSGVSTAEMVTDLSGRGLGLPIVREKVERLGGNISVQTKTGEGTEFKLEIPTSIVSFRGVHVRSAGSDFVIPTLKIKGLTLTKRSDINKIKNKDSVIWQNKTLLISYLNDLLKIPAKASSTDFFPILFVQSGNNTIALAVDEVLSEDEFLVKQFNKHLAYVKYILGATVLASGKLALVLNIGEVGREAIHSPAADKLVAEVADEEKVQNILIVEDSITSRILLKNIVESAGYNVVTAVDGVSGFMKLGEGIFDLVVSDVDMPRMNGFELTKKIREDERYAETPVVLVTSLSKPEDRERGLEVGASAYIIKSNFSNSNLVDVIKRLI